MPPKRLRNNVRVAPDLPSNPPKRPRRAASQPHPSIPDVEQPIPVPEDDSQSGELTQRVNNLESQNEAILAELRGLREVIEEQRQLNGIDQQLEVLPQQNHLGTQFASFTGTPHPQTDASKLWL